MSRLGLLDVSARLTIMKANRLDLSHPAFERWSGGVADIVPGPTGSVEGLLHGLADESDLPKMDRREGVHLGAHRRASSWRSSSLARATPFPRGPERS